MDRSNRTPPPTPQRRGLPLAFVWLGTALPIVLACGGAVDCGRTVNKVVPAIRELDPEYNTEPVDCDIDYPSPSPRGCAIEELRCDSVVMGNTNTGFSHFDEEFYQAQKCTPERHGYRSSPEAPYSLVLPANTWADIILVSDCADLDVFSATWDNPAKCPTPSHTNINQCEADTSRRGGTIVITTVDKPEKHLVWVDGKNGATGNFRLEVKCRLYR